MGFRDFTLKPVKKDLVKGDLSAHDKAVSFVIFALILIILLQVGYKWVNSWLYFRRVQVVVAEESKVDSVLSTEGIIVRNEKVVFSDDAGMVLGKIPEGDRIHVGGEVVTIVTDYSEPPETKEAEEPHQIVQYYESARDWILDMFFIEREPHIHEAEENDSRYSNVDNAVSVESPAAGLVSYQIDGLEERYLPGYPYDLLQRYKELEDKPAEGDSIERNTIVSRGSPVFRIVDNYEWFYSIAVDHETGRRIGNRNNVEVTFSFAPDDPVSGYQVDLNMDRDSGLTFVTYRFRRQLPGFTRHRWVEADIKYHTVSGIKVPSRAIFQGSDNEEGLFLNDRGIVVYRPVTILYQGDDFNLVEGINPESIVITRPDLVQEGQRLE